MKISFFLFIVPPVLFATCFYTTFCLHFPSYISFSSYCKPFFEKLGFGSQGVLWQKSLGGVGVVCTAHLWTTVEDISPKLWNNMKKLNREPAKRLTAARTSIKNCSFPAFTATIFCVLHMPNPSCCAQVIASQSDRSGFFFASKLPNQYIQVGRLLSKTDIQVM